MKATIVMDGKKVRYLELVGNKKLFCLVVDAESAETTGSSSKGKKQ